MKTTHKLRFNDRRRDNNTGEARYVLIELEVEISVNEEKLCRDKLHKLCRSDKTAMGNGSVVMRVKKRTELD